MYLGQYEVVVRGQTTLIALEAYLLRCILSFQLFFVGRRCPIAVGQYAIMVHFELRRQEDVVDAALRLQVGLKGIEGSILAEALLGHGIRVVQQSRVGEDGVDFVVLVDIEVTREDDRRLTVGEFLYLLHDELGPFASGDHSDMVHVQIEIIELHLGSLVAELTPSADSYAGGIPSESGTVGGLTEPEVAVVEQLQIVFFEEDG